MTENVWNICMHPCTFSILMVGWMIHLGANIQARLYKLSEKDDSGLDVGYKRKIDIKNDVMFFGLSNWEDEVAINRDEDLWGGNSIRRWCSVLAVWVIRSLLDIQMKVLSKKLDIKVCKEAWEGGRYLGVDSMWIVFKSITKGVSGGREMFCS